MIEAMEMEAGKARRRSRRARPNVQELIRNALDEAEGDETTAVSMLVDQALADVDYVREIFSLAVQALNRHSRTSKRALARRSAQSSATSIRSLGTALARPLLEFPLQDGTPLKDAYQPQVERAAAQFGQQGRTMMHMARWLGSIQAKMAPEGAVGESLDELTVRQLFDETVE